MLGLADQHPLLTLFSQFFVTKNKKIFKLHPLPNALLDL